MPKWDSNWRICYAKRLFYHCANLAMIIQVFIINNLLTASIDVTFHSKRLVADYYIENGQFKKEKYFPQFTTNLLILICEKSHYWKIKTVKMALLFKKSYYFQKFFLPHFICPMFYILIIEPKSIINMENIHIL